MTTATDSATVLKCRYRYATGCTADYATKPGLSAHEKNFHAEQRVELRVCPECGTDCGTEMARAAHLSNEHGIRAGTPRRQELDALQVQELLGTRTPDGAAAAQAAEPPAPAEPRAPQAEPAAAVAPGGKPAGAPELPVVRNILAALVDEVEALRAENAALKARNDELEAESATFATVRSLLAGQHGQNGQNGTRDHVLTS